MARFRWILCRGYGFVCLKICVLVCLTSSMNVFAELPAILAS